MDKIAFSVVMPVYNKEAFVENAIRSVLNQTYPEFELIVIDDGSTDGSLSAAKSVHDKRIKFIRQVNQGASAARNLGIKSAKYPNIAFLDSDDLWLPDFLETMVRLIEKYPQAEAFGCAYLHERVYEDTFSRIQAMEKSNNDRCANNYFEYAANHEQTLTASTSVVKYNIINKVGAFPIGLKNWEDLDFWSRIGLYSPVAFTDRICAIYNDLNTGASKALENLHAPVFDNFKIYLNDDSIPLERRISFEEYVIEHKFYSAYQQYLIDRKGLRAIRTILPYFYTKKHKNQYLSMLIQFVITPESFLKINNYRRMNR